MITIRGVTDLTEYKQIFSLLFFMDILFFNLKKIHKSMCIKTSRKKNHRNDSYWHFLFVSKGGKKIM